MRVVFDPSPLRESVWQGHLLRFIAGGLVTVATGLVGKRFGPVVGGLFLAFPAIFPVGLTLIERLQNRQAGPGARGHRARRAALADSVGAACGSVGLIIFAIALWLGLSRWSAPATFVVAILGWSALAFGGWAVRRRLVNVFPHASRAIPPPTGADRAS